MGPDDALQLLEQQKLSSGDALTRANLELNTANANPRWALVACYALWWEERFEDAISLHQTWSVALAQDADAWVLAGMCAMKLTGQGQIAENAYQKALSIDPHRFDCHYNLGNLNEGKNHHNKAINCYFEALKINSNHADCWHNLGISLRKSNCIQQSKRALQNSIKLSPNNAESWCNLGISYNAFSDLETSKQIFLHSIYLSQDRANNQWIQNESVLNRIDPQTALKAFQKGQELNPKSHQSLFNIACTMLQLDHYEQGWYLYESRFATKSFNCPNIPSSGRWITNSSQLNQARSPEHPILIWSEQGFGDSIQFIRYLTILKSLQIHFQFACRTPLLSLFQQWSPVGQSVIDEGQLSETLKTASHCALLSLPYLLGTTRDTIPASVPYLTPPGPPPESLVVMPPPGGLSVGLVWASGPDNTDLYETKSIPLDILLPCLLPAAAEGLIALHCLQVGADSRQLEPFRHHSSVIDWGPKLKDFSDTAHIINQLDLVISVDTAVAHLAGALEIPTWLVLAFNSDFRWGTQRSTCPWYQTLRLFRQPQIGNWHALADDLADAMGQLVGLDLTTLNNPKI